MVELLASQVPDWLIGYFARAGDPEATAAADGAIGFFAEVAGDDGGFADEDGMEISAVIETVVSVR